ncbi:MAG: DMT family transporter [Alistipes sp.]
MTDKPHTHKEHVIAHMALIFANILLGMNFSFFISIIRRYMPFETLFFLRVVVSAVWFVPWAILFKRFGFRSALHLDSDPDGTGDLRARIPDAVGRKYTNPVDASTLATMAPIVTLSVSALLMREKIHRAKIIGIILGVAGSAVLILGNGWPQQKSEEIGNLLILISVFAAATNTVFIKPELMKFGTMTVTGWYYIIGVLIAAPFFGKKLVDFDFSSLPAIGVAEIAYILILGTMLPNYLLYYGTEKLTLCAYGPVLLSATGGRDRTGHLPQPSDGRLRQHRRRRADFRRHHPGDDHLRPYKFPVPKVGTPPAAQQPRGQNAGK